MSVLLGCFGAREHFGSKFLPIAQNQVILPLQFIGDAPSFTTQGFMLDAGRKYHSPDFITDLFAHASFFIIRVPPSLLCSDIVPLVNANEWQDLYTRFRFHSNDLWSRYYL